MGNNSLAYLEVLDKDNKNSSHKQLSDHNIKYKNSKPFKTTDLSECKRYKKEANSTSTLGSGRPSCEYNLVQNCMRDMGPNAAVWGGKTHTDIHSCFTLNPWMRQPLPCVGQSVGIQPYSWCTPTQQWTVTSPFTVPLSFNTHICLYRSRYALASEPTHTNSCCSHKQRQV